LLVPYPTKALSAIAAHLPTSFMAPELRHGTYNNFSSDAAFATDMWCVGRTICQVVFDDRWAHGHDLFSLSRYMHLDIRHAVSRCLKLRVDMHLFSDMPARAVSDAEMKQFRCSIAAPPPSSLFHTEFDAADMVADVVHRLLQHDPKRRPSAESLLSHPAFRGLLAVRSAAADDETDVALMYNLSVGSQVAMENILVQV